ncbi:hypothetical protein [Kitasatospora sp. NPDC057015]|uniref:hypothetical protein n=1 Tax=Kitasatospora sp. NPDC057015 TaxID=3346001 RepID=UPI003636EE96
MARKHAPARSFARLLESVGPPAEPAERYGPAHLDPVHDGGFTDAEGCRWALSRGPIDTRRAKRLALGADLLWTGDDEYDEDGDRLVPVYVPAADRAAAWQEIRPRLNAADGHLPFHHAFEFVSAGRVLLYVETYC